MASRRPGERSSARPRAPGVAVAALGLAVFLAFAAEGLDWLRARRVPTGQAAWIWAPGEEAGQGAVAFYAVRDFEVADWPVPARLLVAADEEYQLLLNGDLVGSAEHRDGDGLDAYDVGTLLRPGANRLVAEVRSGRGIGGLLVSLELTGTSPPRLASGADWKIVRAFDRALLDPALPLAAGAVPRVWARPPVGRWGMPRPPQEAARPLLQDLVTARPPRLPERARALGGGAPWTAIRRVDWRSPSLGPRVTFDFGRTVTGYLNLVFTETGKGSALFWTGETPPRAGGDPVAGYALKLDGTRSWSASEPRRFRYVTVWSTAALSGARAFEVDPDTAGVRIAGEAGPEGVFGLAAPPLPSPAEHEIRRELERLAGDAAG